MRFPNIRELPEPLLRADLISGSIETFAYQKRQRYFLLALLNAMARTLNHDSQKVILSIVQILSDKKPHKTAEIAIQLAVPANEIRHCLKMMRDDLKSPHCQRQERLYRERIASLRESIKNSKRGPISKPNPFEI